MTDKFIFFGTPEYAVNVLAELVKNGLIPVLVICSPDAPVGRKKIITAPPTKVFAERNGISVFQPNKIDSQAIEYIKTFNPKYAIVAAYNKILPKKLLELLPEKFLNVHPSLLPKYRGPAPDIGPILHQDTATGVTIIVLDELVDHGPILMQEKVELNGTEYAREMGARLFTRGGEMLCSLIPEWLQGKIVPETQNHNEATFTKKLTKDDGEINLEEDPKELWAKWRAYRPWPGLYFFKNSLRVKITKARFENGQFVIEKVIPEGGKEMDYAAFTARS